MRTRFAALAGALALVLAACSGGAAVPDDGTAAPVATLNPDETVTITIWGHQGQEAEVAATKATVEAFNASQTQVKAELTFFPEADYPKTIAATKPEDLPDVLEFDGPNLASLVYAGKIAPLDGVVSQAVIDNQIKSALAQNTSVVDGKVYALSQFDSGLALYGNTALLEAAGVDYPTTFQEAWTAAEFTDVLAALAAQDEDGKVFDIKENYAGEWPGYAFLPIVNSAGFLAVRGNKADGNLNAPAVVEAFRTFASWRDYVDPNTDDKAFTGERVALSWVGHWVYNDYKKALGDKLVLIPLPDFGAGTKSGQGSLTWGMSATTTKQAAAAKYLEFSVADEHVKAMTDANGAPPGTKTVTAASALYGPGGELTLYADQLAATCGSGDVELSPACVDVPRPGTPAWPVISAQFSQAFWDAYKGSDPQAALDAAARAIDQDITDNGGYE